VAKFLGVTFWCSWCGGEKHFKYPESEEEAKNYVKILLVSLPEEYIATNRVLERGFCPKCAEKVKSEISKTESGYMLSDILKLFPNAKKENII
jgi:hypothetical protein